jgi:hypothetical protein
MILKRFGKIAVEHVHARATEAATRTILKSEIIERTKAVGVIFRIGEGKKYQRRYPDNQFEISANQFYDIYHNFQYVSLFVTKSQSIRTSANP